MNAGLLALTLAAVGFIALQVALLRWIFRINRILATLQSIDRSLQMLPAVRDARIQQARRKAA